MVEPGKEVMWLDPRPLGQRDVETPDAGSDLRYLKRILENAIRAAESVWPEVRVSPEAFMEHLARCVDKGTLLAASRENLALCDLYLASAGMAGNAAALNALSGIVQEVAQTAVAGGGEGLQQDVAQEFNERLLFGTSSVPPLLARYNGMASLRGWLRLMMVRRAAELKRKELKYEPFEEQVTNGLAFDAGDPELSILKSHYAREFRAAFKSALMELEVDDRNILRYLVVDGLKVKQIARFFGVNRVTISKRMQAIRRRLLKQTRLKLAVSLCVDPGELDSIIRFVQSRLDISFTCLADPS